MGCSKFNHITEIVCDVAVDVVEDSQEVRNLEDDDDELKCLEHIADQDDCHDLVVVQIDVVGHFWIFADALQTSIKEVFDLFHKHSSIQKSDCWNQPVALDQVEKSTVWKIQEKVERNEWTEVIDEICVDVSHTDQGNVLNLLVCDLISVFNEELEDAVKEEDQLHDDL